MMCSLVEADLVRNKGSSPLPPVSLFSPDSGDGC